MNKSKFFMTKSKFYTITYTLLFLCFFTQGTQAQMGVNTSTPRVTLHVEPTDANNTTIAEGIMAPNLTLAQLTAKDNAYTSAQKGALVYVYDVTTGTTSAKTINVGVPGYYNFDGDIWKNVGGSPWLIQGTTNAASKNDDNIYQMGSVAIGANSAGTNKLLVEGSTKVTDGLYLDNLETSTGSSITGLSVDNITGLVGLSEVLPAKLLFIQTSHEQYLGSSVNATNSFKSVLWPPTGTTSGVPGSSNVAKTSLTNNIVVGSTGSYTDFPDGTFKFEKDGRYEFSGYINFYPGTSPGSNNAVNIILQYYNGSNNTWIDFAATRGFGLKGLTQTIALSPSIRDFSAGDIVRLIVLNPGVTGAYGNNAAIDLPNGITFTRALKILQLN